MQSKTTLALFLLVVLASSSRLLQISTTNPTIERQDFEFTQNVATTPSAQGNHRLLAAKRYVTNITFIVTDSSKVPEGEDVSKQNLNEGAGGKYIYAVRQWTTDPKLAITGWGFLSNKQPGAQCKQGYEKLNQNLNEGVPGAFYNYLCVKRGGTGAKVTNIAFVSFCEPFVWDYLDFWAVFPADLNRATTIDSKYVYLFYTAEN